MSIFEKKNSTLLAKLICRYVEKVLINIVANIKLTIKSPKVVIKSIPVKLNLLIKSSIKKLFVFSLGLLIRSINGIIETTPLTSAIDERKHEKVTIKKNNLSLKLNNLNIFINEFKTLSII